ncbi:hypothetical protein VNO80_25619 [Phaseolus coccineus]|uniref:NAD(P)H dehydrogenase (quinone) n=1 Tax=Phaseolus coccineus TaxID=3886 RepID=A0AAN9QTI9_PHACN
MNSNSSESASAIEKPKSSEGSTMPIKVHVVYALYYSFSSLLIALTFPQSERRLLLYFMFFPLFLWFSLSLLVPDTLAVDKVRVPRAPWKTNVPIISRKELLEGDGFVFGFPTRYGMMAAEFQAFLDSTGSLWNEEQQLLKGKPAGIFFSTGCQGGGQETTALCAVPQLVNRGMLFVPIGHILGDGNCEMEEVRGGSPFGAGTYAGTDGLREPSEFELKQAFHQGKYIATITKKLKRDPQFSFPKIARRLSQVVPQSY